MKIFNDSHLLFDITVKNQKEAFEKIANHAKKLGIVKNTNNLVKGLMAREKVSTTGMKDSFAIPHAKNSDIIKPAILAVRFKNGVQWKSVDGKPVKFAIVLLIPKKNLSDLHMEYLARISTSLMDEVFCSKLLKSKSKAEIIKLVSSSVNEKNTTISKTKAVGTKKVVIKNAKANIIGVTACATGIAHTFMARESLEKEGARLGYNVHVETEGQGGREHVLTDELIAKADYVIIATDINVETDRFEGKKIFFCNTNAAINNPEKVFTNTIQTSKVHGNGQPASKATTFTKEKRGGFMKHMLSGVSHMIPFVVFSGIVFAVLNAVSVAIYPGAVPVNTPLWYAMQAAGVGFSVFLGIMGGYIGESIGGRPAMAPAFIGSVVASTPAWYIFYPGIPKAFQIHHDVSTIDISGVSLSLVGVLLMSFAAGYLVKWITSWNVKPIFRSVMSILFIPVFATSVLVFPFLFGLSGILGAAMNGFAWCLATMGSINGLNFVLGFLLGAMIGFDMGGPINKIAVTTGSCLIALDPRIMGACAAAIPVAPLGCGVATLIGRKLFDDSEKQLGYSALALGFMGISEGSIPFFAKRPKITVISNVIGSACAGGLAFMFFVGAHVAMWGGPLIACVGGIYSDPGTIHSSIPSIFGGEVPNSALSYISIFWYLLAMITGILIQATIYVSLVNSDNKRLQREQKRNNPSSSIKKVSRKTKFVLSNINYSLNLI